MRIPIYKSNIPNEIFIKIFENIIKENGVPEEYISTNGYSEDRICLEENNGKLQVFYAYRNIKDGLKEYDKIDEALRDIADRCTESEEQYKKVVVEYEKEAEQYRYAGMLEVDGELNKGKNERDVNHAHGLAILCVNKVIKAERSNTRYRSYVTSKNKHKIANDMHMKRKAGRKKSRFKKDSLNNKRIGENV